jgi:hypothetical protein
MMPAMRWIGGLFVAVAAGWVASACGSSVFACSSDEQCESGGMGGVCQPDGYCSFPDDSCPSGHRFGDGAPAGVANACVEASGTGSSDSGPEPAGSSDGIEPPDPDGTPEGSSTATADDDPTTTTPLDDGTSTGEPNPTTGEDDDSTTGEVEETCRVEFVDPFDGEELLPMWSSFAQPATELWVADGQLRIYVGASPDAWAVAGAMVDVDSMNGGWARALVTEPDTSGVPIAGGVVFGNELCQLQLYVEATSIVAALWNNDTLMTTLLGAHELPELPLWLQIRQDEYEYLEWSTDGVTWNELARGPFPECGDLLSAVSTGVNVGGQLELMQEGMRSFDQFELCLP